MENSDHILYNSFILTSAIVLDCMRLMRNNNNNNQLEKVITYLNPLLSEAGTEIRVVSIKGY